jgi:hypothetical protein
MDALYNQNTNTSNDAQMKNLGIYDQQYTRQAQAKSNTKATAQAALNSISSKYAQHDLENRTLKTYENMYNYRYGKDFRLANMNGFFQPNMPTVGSTEGQQQVPVYKADGVTIDHYQLVPTQPSMSTRGFNPNGRNGSIVKAIKDL